MDIKSIHVPHISYKLPSIMNEASTYAEVTGTIIKLSNKFYILTVNHGLPIKELYIKDNVKTKYVYNNSEWCESIVIPMTGSMINKYILPDLSLHSDIEIPNYMLFSKWQIAMPHILNDMYTIINNNLVSLTYVKVHFESLHLFKNNPYTIYIIAELPKGHNYELISGNSGSPVFIKTPTGNKLVGILTRYHKEHNVIYIIPIHIFMKSIEKQDNINIFGIDTTNISNINNITKIGRYKIFQDPIYGSMIFDVAMRCRIPISTYFLIYGDINKKYNITFTKNGETFTEIIDAYIINNQLSISPEIKIIKRNNKYKVTIGLLHLLKLTQLKLLYKLFEILNRRIELKENNNFWITLPTQ